MKKIFLLILLISLHLSLHSRAESSAGLGFVVGAIGGAVATTYDGYLGRLPSELSDWKDPKTQSTSRLESQCGVLSEVKLVRTGRFNLLFIGLRNESKDDLSIQLDRIAIKFDQGRERFAMSSGQQFIEVKKNWYTWGFVALPRKNDFKGQTWAEVSLPVMINNEKPCAIVSKFNRDLSVPEDESTYVEAPTFIASLGIGASTFSGRMFDTFDSGTSVDLYMAGFSVPRLGTYLQVSMNAVNNLKSPAYFGSAAYTEGRTMDLSIGKSIRFFYNDISTGFLNFGPSFVNAYASTSYTGGSYQVSTGTYALGAYASYTQDWRYAREYVGFFRGDYSFGLTFYGKYYPYFDSNNKDAGIFGVTLEVLRGGI